MTPPVARILKPTPENLALCADALRRGELVGMPTETVYGLAGSAFDPKALAGIFDKKERPTFDPLIVHVGALGRGVNELSRLHLIDRSKMSELASSRAQALIEAFWPGPLTLVLPKHETVPDLATSGLPSVALRMPRHPVAQALIALSETPLAAPSANRFGRISPTTAQAVFEELGDRIGYILDGGSCEIGLESTVLAIGENGELTLLRPGGTPREKIEEVAKAKLALSPDKAPQASPGMLESHYAPKKPLFLLPKKLSELTSGEWEGLRAKIPSAARRAGLLVQSGQASRAEKEFSELLGIPVHAISLSEKGDLGESARRLFSALRELDASDSELLFAEPCARDEGLGHAISDRLRRASKR